MSKALGVSPLAGDRYPLLWSALYAITSVSGLVLRVAFLEACTCKVCLPFKLPPPSVFLLGQTQLDLDSCYNCRLHWPRLCVLLQCHEYLTSSDRKDV